MSAVEEETVETEAAAPVVQLPPATVKAGTAARQFQEQEDQDILTWLQSFGPLGAVQVQVMRAKPEFVSHRGRKIDIKGLTETYDHVVTEDDIKSDHGGGTYDLRIKRQNDKGSYIFWKSRRIEIAGPPKTDKILADAGEDLQPQQAEAPGLSQQALSTVTKLLNEERAREDKGKGIDADIIDRATGPLLEALRESREEARETRQALAKLHERPAPPTSQPATEKILEKMIVGGDTRIDSLRLQFESERNALTLYWQGEVKRAGDAAERQVATLEKGHEREMRSIEKAHDQAMATLKSSYDMQIDGLKREIGRLEREIVEKGGEIGELRGQKTKTTSDMIDEVEKLRTFFKGDDDEEKGSTAERVIETILGSGPVAAIASRIAAPPAQPQQPAHDPFAAIPLGQPFQYNGQVVMKVQMPNGQIALAPARRKKKAVPAPAKPGDAAQPQEEPQISNEDLATAVTYIESAINSRTSPVEFAATAKIAAPQVVGIVRKFGIEKLLSLAKLSDDSPISTQKGKGFLREFAEALTAS